ncbi:hypothetical protein [Veillonella agrestimuris]|uniref:phage NrS-1 polymerase family protein n=1 Tax=Veillonella agrestimuris TaxID=2941340 RepID=UPI00203C2C85|nr:hypothetical protein [Veillonella agrestimuris]
MTELYNNIPTEMKHFPNWLVRKGKVPYSPITHKQGNSADICGTFEQAMQALQNGQYDGLGFHFDNTPFTGIDLDHHITNGAFDEMAMQLFIDCHSYTEYSPSGTGVHIIVKGETPQSVKNSPLGFEMYSQGRYFTVTGNVVQGAPLVVNARQDVIQTLYDTFALHPVDDAEDTTIGGISLEPVYSEVELLQLIERIKNSNQGDKFTRLFIEGDLLDYNGDASRADAGLLSILEFWTRGHAQKMHDLFCLSALAKRDKWQHGNTGHNPMYYRALTIRRVIARQNYIRKQEHEKAVQAFTDSFYD